MQKSGLILAGIMPRPARIQMPPLNLGDETFGKRLARLRKEKGFTQVELAKKIGTIQSIISDYERDRLRPHADMIARFAIALEVSADECLGLKTVQPSKGSNDRRFLRRLNQIRELPKRDQDALIRTIDAFLSKTA